MGIYTHVALGSALVVVREAIQPIVISKNKPKLISQHKQLRQLGNSFGHFNFSFNRLIDPVFSWNFIVGNILYSLVLHNIKHITNSDITVIRKC